nr:interleukin-1 receptor type 1-like isoform X2 [Scatophagus argus]
MAAAGWVFLLVVLLSQALAVAHYHSRDTDTYYVSAGHLFLLRCHIADAHTNVTWSREGSQRQSLPNGVEVRDGLLWFLPVQMSHNGSYACEKRDGTGLRMKFELSVSSGKCPELSETKSIPKGVSEGLPCKQKDIFQLNATRNIQWLKDCQPVQPQGQHIYVHDNGFMRLLPASEVDAGTYTCLIEISLDGRDYTAARSIQLTIENEIPVFTEIEMVYPQQEVVIVEVGMRVELRCLAYVGFSEDNDILMYWTVNSTYADDYKELNESWKYIHERGRVYSFSTLSISTVLHQFLNVPIHCHVVSPADNKRGSVCLQQADHSALHTSIALCLAAPLTIVALIAAFLLFKVDLVLAYRKLLRHFSKQHISDGKLYDAYVSFLHPDTSSADTESFALQILPEKLEKQHGYSLYIRGRDDCPGEAVHDVIAATVSQCRRLIIILSPKTKDSTHGEKEEKFLRDNQDQLSYEQKTGLYDTLTQSNPKVILVEIDGPVDYSCLPESLRYIKRKYGSLKWKKPSPGTHKFTKLCSNRKFWKNLRYYMPSVPDYYLNQVKN